MFWTLVFITIIEGQVYSQKIDTYADMLDCFNGREQIALTLGSFNGYFPVNTQAICVLSQHETETEND